MAICIGEVLLAVKMRVLYGNAVDGCQALNIGAPAPYDACMRPSLFDIYDNAYLGRLGLHPVALLYLKARVSAHTGCGNMQCATDTYLLFSHQSFGISALKFSTFIRYSCAYLIA